MSTETQPQQAQVQLPVSTLTADSPVLLSLLSQSLSDQLAYPATAKIDTFSQESAWSFACGEPLGVSGEPLDYSKTQLAQDFGEGLVDNYFCALIQHTESGLEIRELVVGVTDAPMLDWIDKHSLPGSLF